LVDRRPLRLEVKFEVFERRAIVSDALERRFEFLFLPPTPFDARIEFF
jgi:hypothetical protein